MQNHDGHVTVMPKKLAQALMDAGMKHMDGGGIAGLLGGATNNYTAPTPTINDQNFNSQIGADNAGFNNIYGQQLSFANTLLNQANGQGPNPAQAALNQNTAQNVQNQGAMMASQRGASANPALIARQAAQQGAATQQQAVGQSATLQAQQQLAAQQAVQAQQQAMQNEAIQQQSVLQGANAAQNSAITQGSLGQSNIAANAAGQNAATNAGIWGGLMQGIGGALSGPGGGGGGGAAGLASLLYKGGEVKKMADGGPVNDNVGIANEETPGVNVPALGSWEGLQGYQQGLTNQFKNSVPKYGGQSQDPSDPFNQSDSPNVSTLANSQPAGFQYPTGNFAKGGNIPFSTALLNGGKVPGKASVPGDNEKNDQEPTLLSPGEIVVPRSITMAKDAPAKAAEFIKHLQQRKSGKGGYGEVVGAKKSLKDRVEYLEKCMGGRI